MYQSIYRIYHISKGFKGIQWGHLKCGLTSLILSRIYRGSILIFNNPIFGSPWGRSSEKKDLQIPDDITGTAIALKDQYFDLKGLSAYSSMAVPTLRDYISTGQLPCFKLKGKFLIKRSEFDTWLEGFRLNKGQDLNDLVDGAMASLKV